ncbi:hypothetical protein HY837_00740 [archaeon]|nr:hypothetical protein [archaeon]
MSEQEIPETGETNKSSETKSLIYLFVGVAIIALVFLLLFFVMKNFNPYKPEQVTYNYFSFVKKDTHWLTDWQGNDQLYELGFRFNPFEAETVPVIGKLNSSFDGKKVIYVTLDPLSKAGSFKYIGLAKAELLLVLNRALKLKTEEGCIQQDNIACVEEPIVNCDSADKNVIYIKHASPAQITLNNSCITIQGNEFELIKSVDRLLYQWLKIMQ